MLGFIVMLLLISSLGDRRSGRMMVRGIFTFLAVMYSLRLVAYAGIHFLPAIILVWLLMKVVVPFMKGFMHSFHREGV